MITKFLFSFILLVFMTDILFAQKPQLEFTRILNPHQEPFAYTSNYIIDNQGLIWFGQSSKGLIRYDGSDCKLYKLGFNDSTFLDQIQINCITRVGNDSLLLCLETQGIFYFINERLVRFKENERFKKFHISYIWVDKDKNWWMWGNNLYKYSPGNGNLRPFWYSVDLYNPELYTKLKDKSLKAIDGFLNVGNSQDLEKTFSIEKDTKVLVVSVGEGNINGMDDYGSIRQNYQLVWKMQYYNSREAGGNEKNRVAVEIINLKKGTYQLKYKSDYSHSWNNWNTPQPEYIDFYGIKLFEIPDNFASKIENLTTERYIPNDTISSMFRLIDKDKTGNIWFLSDYGMAKFDSQKDSFVYFQINFRKILGDAFGDKNFFFSKIHFTSDSIVWIGTSNGLIKYNFKNGAAKTYQNLISSGTSLFNNKVINICTDVNNNLWALTDKSIELYNKSNDDFYHYPIGESTGKDDILNETILPDNSGNIFFGTLKSGFNKVSIKKFNSFKLNVNSYTNHWWPVCFDHNKILWYCELSEGILKSYDKSGNIYKDFKIDRNLLPIEQLDDSIKTFWLNAMYEDHYNNFWLAIGPHLCLFDRNKWLITKVIDLNIKNKGFENNEIIGIYEDSNQNLWVYTYKGIYHLDYNNFSFDTFIDFPLTIYDSNNCISFLLEYKGTVFFRTHQGIFAFDSKELKVKPIVKFETPAKIPEYNFTGNIFKDSMNCLWFATETKLYSYDPENAKIKQFQFSGFNQSIYGEFYYNSFIICEYSNSLWFSTGKGLYKFDKQIEKFSSFTENEGLTNNAIFCAAKDKNGFLWLGSHTSISRFSLKNESFTNYYGVSDFNFTVRNFENTINNDEIAFYTVGSFVTINENLINKYQPQIAFTKFSISGKEYLLDSALNQKNHIILNYDQNFIAFEFSVLDFTDNKLNKYAYKLEGVDKHWVYCDYNNRKANYTELSPGKYIFRVKGANNEDVWNEKGISINIEIKPPFWQTWWFRGIGIIIIIILVWQYNNYRERLHVKDKESLEKTVKERTAEIEQKKEEITAQRDEIMQKSEILEQQNEEIEAQRDALSHQKDEIISSIQYAQRIQHAVLPDDEIIKNNLPDFFVLYKPRDIVSGDFYWFKKVRNFAIMATADCTGHGVPGAFMSMLGVSLLNEIVGKSHMDTAGEILNNLRKKVKSVLHQHGKDLEQKDGMDIALCIFDLENFAMQYAGAYNPLYLVRNNELTEYKADPQPCAVHIQETVFTTHEIKIQKDDVIYTFSDGYIDQYGGENHKKYLSKNFRNYLLSICHEPMERQKELLDNNIEAWKNGREQIDDITVVGVKV